MQNLWRSFSSHFHWLLFLFLETVSVVMLFSYNSYQGSVWISSANVVAGKVFEWQASVEQFFSLTDRNDELDQRNFYLERQVDQLRRLYRQHGQRHHLRNLRQHALPTTTS